MTATDLLKTQIDDAAYQLGKALEGMTDEQMDAKPLPTMMSAREQADHLCECYIACAKMVAGQEHEWGSYSAPDKTWAALISEMWSLRSAAERAVLAGDDKALGLGSSFLASHDTYHVGQLAALRIAVDPAWDPYSIYKS